MPDGLCRRLLPKSSLTSSAASSPQGCPGSSTPPTNARATRARPARPASVTLSRTAALTISAPAFSAALVPGNQRDHRADKGMHVRLSGARQARDTRASAARPWKTDGYIGRPGARTPSAMRPWTPQRPALQRYRVAHTGTEKKRPAWPRIPS